jgi:transcriptional regulator GlxA family with amidase domain
MHRWKTGILVFPDVEVLDFCGPFEVFSVTRRHGENRRTEPSPFEVFLVAETMSPVRAAGGLRVTPDHTFETCPQLDILLAPGGWGTREEVHNSRLIDWLKGQAIGVQWLASVCTGSFLLGTAGLLAGKRATTHWMSLDRMRATFSDVTVEDHLHWTQDGQVLTSAGISAGIDLALQLVQIVCGEQIARDTAKYMEYSYPENSSRRI